MKPVSLATTLLIITAAAAPLVGHAKPVDGDRGSHGFSDRWSVKGGLLYLKARY